MSSPSTGTTTPGQASKTLLARFSALTTFVPFRVTLIGILRVFAFRHLFFDKGYDFGNSWGPTYSIIEPCLAIACGCVPSIRPLLLKWFPRVFQRTVPSGKSTGPYHDLSGSFGAGKSAGSASGRRPGSGVFPLKDLGRHNRAETETVVYSPRGSGGKMAATGHGIVRVTQVGPFLSSQRDRTPRSTAGEEGKTRNNLLTCYRTRWTCSTTVKQRVLPGAQVVRALGWKTCLWKKKFGDPI